MSKLTNVEDVRVGDVLDRGDSHAPVKVSGVIKPGNGVVRLHFRGGMHVEREIGTQVLVAQPRGSVFTKQDLYRFNHLITTLRETGYAEDAEALAKVRDAHFDEDGDPMTANLNGGIAGPAAYRLFR